MFNKFSKFSKKAFTLIELVVVIAVIAILTAVSIGTYFGITISANESKLREEGLSVFNSIVRIANIDPNDDIYVTSECLYIETKDVKTLEDKLIEDRAINIDVTRDVKEVSVNIDTVCLSNETKENEENFYFYLRYFSDDVKDKYALIDISTKEVIICKIGDNYDVEDIPLKDLSKVATFNLGDDSTNELEFNKIEKNVDHEFFNKEINGHTFEVVNSHGLTRGFDKNGTSVIQLGNVYNAARNENGNIGEFDFKVTSGVKKVVLHINWFGYGSHSNANGTINDVALEGRYPSYFGGYLAYETMVPKNHIIKVRIAPYVSLLINDVDYYM